MLAMNSLVSQMHTVQDGCYAKANSTYDGHPTQLITDPSFYPKKARANCLGELTTKMKREKLSRKKRKDLRGTELCRVIQTYVLASCILGLSYQSMRNGKTELSVLQNGKTVFGSMPNNVVITLSLGYSMPYSVVLSATACMLIYSLVSEKSLWGLPLVILYLIDLVCDGGDAMVAICLYFTHLRPLMALFYTAATVLTILVEVWIWLGVFRYFEDKAFK